MMTRENKWLIINAFIFVLVGVLFLFGYNMYKEQLVVNQYKEYIPTVTSLKEEKVRLNYSKENYIKEWFRSCWVCLCWK